MNKRNQSPAVKAKRQYNKMVDYCTEAVWGRCNKCHYPNQCAELTELGLSPGSGVMSDQNNPNDRKIITRVLGVSAKKL